MASSTHTPNVCAPHTDMAGVRKTFFFDETLETAISRLSRKLELWWRVGLRGDGLRKSSAGAAAGSAALACVPMLSNARTSNSQFLSAFSASISPLEVALNDVAPLASGGE